MSYRVSRRKLKKGDVISVTSRYTVIQLTDVSKKSLARISSIRYAFRVKSLKK